MRCSDVVDRVVAAACAVVSDVGAAGRVDDVHPELWRSDCADRTRLLHSGDGEGSGAAWVCAWVVCGDCGGGSVGSAACFDETDGACADLGFDICSDCAGDRYSVLGRTAGSSVAGGDLCVSQAEGEGADSVPSATCEMMQGSS